MALSEAKRVTNWRRNLTQSSRTGRFRAFLSPAQRSVFGQIRAICTPEERDRCVYFGQRMEARKNHPDSKANQIAAASSTLNLRPLGSPSTPFTAASLLSVRGAGVLKNAPAVAKRQPVFLLPADFYRFRWSELLTTFFSIEPRMPFKKPLPIFREIPVAPGRFAGKSVSASLIFHLLGLPLLSAILVFPVRQPGEATLDLSRNEVVYYRGMSANHQRKLPNLAPYGPGSSPGSGKIPGQISTKGASASLGPLYAISRPHVPDNSHQTILQPNAPANLKITNDLKLPNLISAQPQVKRPRIEYRTNEVRPTRPKQRQAETDLPELSEVTNMQVTKGLSAETVKQGHVAAPIGSAPAPLLPSSNSGDSKLEGAPNLVVESGTGRGLTILGLDPKSPTDSISLPAGNRYGQFSIAPNTGGPESPGGVDGGSEGAGEGAAGSGGNESAGVGHGSFGGGGNNSSASGFISMKGAGESEVTLADPGPNAIAQMVYALPASTLLRHNMLVVSAGPIGGGGSNVYGELPCGRIYTVFLPTGGKQWPLQFCRKLQPSISTANKARTTVVHTEGPLIPPEATESYDFKRMPLPPEKAHKSIILRGAIGEDGTVEEVEVRQGLLPSLDAAARLAFSRWKFKPAMQLGKPVRVEVLVAIPGDGTKDLRK